jgi:hypothetical protein
MNQYVQYVIPIELNSFVMKNRRNTLYRFEVN